MSSLNPEQHLTDLNSKVIASLAKVSEVFWVLLQTQAQRYALSATQLQLLLFIKFHPAAHQRKAAYMAREFHVTKATISDSIKALEQKGLIQRSSDVKDTRSFILSLTPKGETLTAAAENFTSPLDGGVEALSGEQKDHLLSAIFDLLYRLNQTATISTQRMCFNCRHYSGDRQQEHYCNLFSQPFMVSDLRLECVSFEKRA